MAERAGVRFPLGRIAALLAVVAMTALPFVSCGPLDFHGHELLRNQMPDLEDAKVKDLPSRLGSGGSRELLPDRDERIFEDGDAWVWWPYLAAFVLAALGVFVRSASRAATTVGALGLAALAAFLLGFHGMLKRDDGPGLRLEVGAYLAILGFAVLAAEGLFVRRRGPSEGG